MAEKPWDELETDAERITWLRDKIHEFGLKMNRMALDLEDYERRLRALERRDSQAS